MFSGYVLLAFLLVGLLFVRHILIYKQEDKINYAPLVMAIGVISALVHLVTYPENKDLILLLRESSFPLMVSLFLYIIMNILHQTQSVKKSILQAEATQDLIFQISELKSFTTDLEKEILAKQNEELQAHEKIRKKFNEDIQVLEQIYINQTKFLEKFDEMARWHKNVTDQFNDFAKMQLPELDRIVHKHIDTLRIEGQEHFRKVKIILDLSLENKCDIEEKVSEVNERLKSIRDMPSDISHAIKEHVLNELADLTKSFESQIITLKSHTEGINTSLYESETSLTGIKKQSKVIVEQMIISSKKMETLQVQSDKLYDTYLIMKDLIGEVELIKSDYEKTKRELIVILEELKSAEAKNIIDMREEIESVSNILTQKIDDSLDKLHKHYHMATSDVSQSIQKLSQKNKLKGYAELEDN